MSMVRNGLRMIWRKCPLGMRILMLRVLVRLRLGAGVSPCDAYDEDADAQVMVLGFFSLYTGLGESARLYADREAASGKKIIRVDFTSLYQTPNMEPAEELLGIAQARTIKGPVRVVVHCNPPQMLTLFLALGAAFLRDKYIVGYWAWELEAVPPVWNFALQYVHSVEAPSEFTAKAIRRATRKPVVVKPHRVKPAKQSGRGYAEDGVTRVLFMFDMPARLSRKNPLAAIEAFRLAFGNSSNAHFTIKVGSPTDSVDMRRLQEALKKSSNIELLTEALSDTELDRLYAAHDIYLSLHRSEGYGLTLHEAMQRGLHVVATGWSANTEFMQGPRAHLVDYELVPLQEDAKVFGVKGARWAEADTQHAARILQTIDTQEREGRNE